MSTHLKNEQKIQKDTSLMKKQGWQIIRKKPNSITNTQIKMIFYTSGLVEIKQLGSIKYRQGCGIIGTSHNRQLVEC